jgi:hypothetical protein
MVGASRNYEVLVKGPQQIWGLGGVLKKLAVPNLRIIHLVLFDIYVAIIAVHHYGADIVAGGAIECRPRGGNANIKGIAYCPTPIGLSASPASWKAGH